MPCRTRSAYLTMEVFRYGTHAILGFADLARISMVCINFRIIAKSEWKQRIEMYNTEYNVSFTCMLDDNNENVRSAPLDKTGEFERHDIAVHAVAIIDYMLLDTSPYRLVFLFAK